jgi:diguanylate cyclase (GGDEF)-like protein
MVIGHAFLKPQSLARVIKMDEGWNVRYNDTEFTDVKLSELRGLIGGTTNKGDRIFLMHEVSGLKDFDSPSIMFETRFSAWRVTCDNKLVEEKYFDAFENGRYIGCDNDYVALPRYATPVELEIEILVSEEGAYNFFEAPILGDYTDLMTYTVYDNLFVLIISGFLIIFGLMFFAIAVGFRSNLPEINMQIYSALLFILLGIWFLTQFEIFDLFMFTSIHQTEIEYISLYLFVPLMYLVMGCMQNYLRNKVFLTFAIVGSAFSVLLILLHFVGIIHINRTLIYYQIDAFIMCIFMIVMLIRDSKQKRITPSQTIQLIGETTLVLSFLFNVFFYYLELAGINKQIMFSKKAVPMGAICMVFASLVNYQIFISESFAIKKEHESLAHLAYADGLTGIPNRSRYEKYLYDLSETDEDYCIVSIDLNGLKRINDGLGHLMGDKYLSEFGKVLNDCFAEKGFIARIGGDEFVVVLKGENTNLADSVINQVNAALDELNRNDTSLNRSAAAGYAFRHEAEGEGWNSVYLLADERMYERKSMMKSKDPSIRRA